MLRFELLKLQCLQDTINAKYSVALNMFLLEVDKIQRLYQEQHQAPPIANNMPPLSGRIVWARQLREHLEGPILRLQGRPKVLRTSQGKLAVRRYNKIAVVLTEYEILHYRSWENIILLGRKNLEVHTRRIWDFSISNYICMVINYRVHVYVTNLLSPIDCAYYVIVRVTMN